MRMRPNKSVNRKKNVNVTLLRKKVNGDVFFILKYLNGSTNQVYSTNLFPLVVQNENVNLR